MANGTKFCCEAIKRWSAPDPEAPMVLIQKTRAMPHRIGIRINAGGNAFISIAYCPWCGSKFEIDPQEVGRKMVEFV